MHPSLARLHLNEGDEQDDCKEKCSFLLPIYPGHVLGSFLFWIGVYLADCSFSLIISSVLKQGVAAEERRAQSERCEEEGDALQACLSKALSLLAKIDRLVFVLLISVGA